MDNVNRGDSFYYCPLLLSTSDISDIIFGRLVAHIRVSCAPYSRAVVADADVDAYIEIVIYYIFERRKTHIRQQMSVHPHAGLCIKHAELILFSG